MSPSDDKFKDAPVLGNNMKTEDRPLRPDYFQIPCVILDDDDLNMVDGLVYAVVYWYRQMKLERCIASNDTIATLIKSTKGSVANSLSRLAKKGYIKVLLDDKKHRLEIIPLVVFSTPSPTSDTPSLTGEPPFTQELTPPSLTGEQNKNILSKRVNEYTNAKALEAVPAKVDKRNPDIQECINALTQLLEGKKPVKETYNRYAAKRLIQAYGKDKTIKALQYAFLIRSEDRYAPGIYDFCQLEEKWQNLVSYGRQKGHQAPRSVNISEIIRQKKEAYVAQDS